MSGELRASRLRPSWETLIQIANPSGDAHNVEKLVTELACLQASHLGLPILPIRQIWN